MYIIYVYVYDTTVEYPLENPTINIFFKNREFLILFWWVNLGVGPQASAVSSSSNAIPNNPTHHPKKVIHESMVSSFFPKRLREVGRWIREVPWIPCFPWSSFFGTKNPSRSILLSPALVGFGLGFRWFFWVKIKTTVVHWTFQPQKVQTCSIYKYILMKRSIPKPLKWFRTESTQISSDQNPWLVESQTGDFYYTQ